jgi:GT2 family glycosyltransferase
VASVDTSFVIVSYNGKEFLHRCLASLIEHTRSADFEIVVVDNASTDGTPDMVARDYPHVVLIRRSENAGFARGVNEGIANARGAYVFILNPDTELDDDVLRPMLAYAREHSDIGVLAPKLLDPDGGTQLSCRAFPGFATAVFNRYSFATRLFRRNPFSQRYLMTSFDHNSVADVDWASAAAWLVPKAVFQRVGPLDEGYFWSSEDVDYCQRVHRAGLRVVYFPRVSILHHIGRSASTAPNKVIIARHRGMWRYYKKYMRSGAPIWRNVLDVSVWLGIQTRCLAMLAVNYVRRAAAG